MKRSVLKTFPSQFESLIFVICFSFSASSVAADQIIKSAISQYYDDHLEELFVWFHQNPELSFLENNTSERLAEELRSLGVEVTEGIGGTGLVGMIENGNGPLVMVRADMDGLPILEDSGLSYV